MKSLDVSILIVNWNTRDILCDCLRSVYEQTQGISFEVIVIDNASSDNSVEMVKQEYAKVILIENQENRGFAAANNQGIRIAKGKYILLLNPDTVVLECAIQKSVAFADLHTEAAVVGIRNDRPDGLQVKNCFQFASVQNLIISLLGLHRLFPRSRFWGRERMTWWDYQDIREVNVVAGCYMLVRRDAIEQVGMLDENYFMYGEEMDWCWRFSESGWKIIYYPEAAIIHYGGMSVEKNPNEMRKELQRSYLYFIEKRQGRLARIIVRLLFFLSGLTRYIYWSILGTAGSRKYREISRTKKQQAMTAMFRI